MSSAGSVSTGAGVAPPLVEVRDLHKKRLLPRDSLRRVAPVRECRRMVRWS